MRPEKASIVSDLAEKLNRSPFVLVADYQHMKVGDFGELRNRLAPAGAEMHVVKNNFLKRAMADSGYPDVADKLIGQTAVVTGEKDVAPVAKILKTFAAEFKIAALKIGFVDRAMLSTSEVETLANLPSRDQTGALAERTGLRVGKGVECKSRKGRKTGGGSDIKREDFRHAAMARRAVKTVRVDGYRP